jgi:hypothetical protein
MRVTKSVSLVAGTSWKIIGTFEGAIVAQASLTGQKPLAPDQCLNGHQKPTYSEFYSRSRHGAWRSRDFDAANFAPRVW